MLAAYTFWGVLPLYFVALAPAGPWELVSMRIGFALVLCMIMLGVFRQFGRFAAALSQPRVLGLLALAAVLVVTIAGIAVRAPLARVPENTMKFAVGIMLTSFGIFWGAEGAGAVWPSADAALLLIVPAVAVFALVLVALLRRVTAAPATTGPAVGGSAVS